jgi:hypothetical protein
MKDILIFFIAILTYASLSGQNNTSNNTSKYKWGLKLGFAISKIDFDDKTGAVNPSINTRTGLIAGAFARIKLGDRAGFQPEVRIIGKGWKETGYYSYDLTYLEFPLNLLYSPTGNKGTFFIGGGPAPAVYIGESLFYGGYSDMKGFDIGVNVLMGYEIPIGFSLSLHYTYGLANVNAVKNDVSIKNRSFGLTAGYTF